MVFRLTLSFLTVMAALTSAPLGQLEQARAPRHGPGNYVPEVMQVYPHDRGAFTQGLVFHEGALLESTGLQGESSLRRVELTTGKVLSRVDVPNQYFAEGIAVVQGKVYQLTWTTGKAFVYDAATRELTGEFTYEGEGWGLTTDGSSLIMSDGTHRIRFIDPATFQTTRVISVVHEGRPLTSLNELEFVKGELLANIWHDDRIVRIDPASGEVLGWIDLSALYPQQRRISSEDVLNGIAYDPASDRVFVTGKRWPQLFELRLRPVSCYLIRQIPYPIRRRSTSAAPTTNRFSLLNICPERRGEVARPVIQLSVGGKKTYAEYEIAKFFASEDEARLFAAMHGIEMAAGNR